MGLWDPRAHPCIFISAHSGGLSTSWPHELISAPSTTDLVLWCFCRLLHARDFITKLQWHTESKAAQLSKSSGININPTIGKFLLWFITRITRKIAWLPNQLWPKHVSFLITRKEFPPSTFYFIANNFSSLPHLSIGGNEAPTRGQGSSHV